MPDCVRDHPAGCGGPIVRRELYWSRSDIKKSYLHAIFSDVHVREDTIMCQDTNRRRALLEHARS